MRSRTPAAPGEITHESDADRPSVVGETVAFALDDASHVGREHSERRRADDAVAQLDRRYRDGLLLAQMNRALMGLFEFDAVTALLCRTARTLLAADGATFVMRNDERVHYVQEDAIAPLWKGQDFPIDACVSGWAITRGETAVIEDVFADPRVPIDAYRPTFVKSMVMAPVGPGLKFASLGLYWQSPKRVTEYDLELLGSLASTADLALSAVRVYQDAERARSEAEQANLLKDQFLSIVSHELRSPLNSIVGFSELLLRDPASAALPAVQRSAGKILKNAQAQAQLINDLLDLSRLQAGTLAIERAPVELAGLVVDAVDSVRADAAEKRVAIALDLAAEPLVIHADAVRIKQIVWNLLHNAVRFTPKDGTVFVRLRASDTRVELEVEDTGQGIAPAFLPKVFDRFRQGDGGLTRAHGGMGVGLALVKQLSEVHDGTVSVTSEGLGRGALFRVELPRMASTKAKEDKSVPARIAKLGGLRMLVVDDSEDSADMLTLLLESEGAEVVTALGAEQALTHADEAFDLIFSDISMPGMDGYELMRRLRQTSRHSHTPAVALTGFGRPEDAAQAREAGFDTHMTKPLDFDRLVQLAQRTVAR